jgi:hypothetical protein
MVKRKEESVLNTNLKRTKRGEEKEEEVQEGLDPEVLLAADTFMYILLYLTREKAQY